MSEDIPKKTPKILIVDDIESNLIALEETLDELDVTFVRALSGNEAVARTLEDDFALVLVDVQMPGMDGLETVKLMRKDKKNVNIPIIFISAIYSDDIWKIKGVRAGAVDFIVKPIAEDILIGKVSLYLQFFQQKQELEEKVRLLDELSRKDALTGLANRRDILEKMEKEAERCSRSGGVFSLVLGDVDSFKIINDTRGHECGDLVLVTLSELLGGSVRSFDVAGRMAAEDGDDNLLSSRWGGEEFLIILPDTNLEQAIHVADRIRMAVEKMDLKYHDEAIELTMSFGVKEFDKDSNLHDCIKQADEFLYEAKQNGKNQVIGR